MKKILSLLLMAVVIFSTSKAQVLIEATNGKCYWFESEVLKDLSSGLTVRDGYQMKQLTIDSIVAWEDMEAGAKLLKADALRTVESTPYKGDPASFFAKGKRVYVPLNNSKVVQKWGAHQLITMLMEDNYWQVVVVPNEADFIIEYVFDESGTDHAYLNFIDRTGNQIMVSMSVSASDWIPAHAGEESAEKLYNKYLKKGIFNNSFKHFRFK